MARLDIVSWLIQERAELLSMLLRMRERRALGLSDDDLYRAYKPRKRDYNDMRSWVSTVVERELTQ